MVQTPPLLLDVCRRRPLIEQIVELAGIALDVVELVVEPAAVRSEIDRIGPVAPRGRRGYGRPESWAEES